MLDTNILVTERAWAAGFFDGEGCVSIKKQRKPGGTTWSMLPLLTMVVGPFGFSHSVFALDSGSGFACATVRACILLARGSSLSLFVGGGHC